MSKWNAPDWAMRIPPRTPESKWFDPALDTRTWVDRVSPRRRHDSQAVQSRTFIVTSWTCISELGYCSAWERGVRHDCEVGKRIAWEHDTGDEDHFTELRKLTGES